MFDWLFRRRRQTPSEEPQPATPEIGVSVQSPIAARPLNPPTDCAYGVWDCLCRTPGCTLCAWLHDVYFLPEVEERWPREGWFGDRKGGCRRIVEYAFTDEGDAGEIAAFLRSLGGTATQAELDAWEEAKMQKVREAGERAREMSQKALRANSLEKEDPDTAISLYREVIARHLDLTRDNSDPFCWRDFGYLYNRLTLVMERTSRWEEALEEITRWEALPHQEQWEKASQEALAKRKMRLQRKLGKKSPGGN